MQHQEAFRAMGKTAAAAALKTATAATVKKRNPLPIKTGTRGRTTESRRLETARRKTSQSRLTRGRKRELRIQETERNKQAKALMHVVEYCNHKTSIAEQEARECHQEAQRFRRMVVALMKRAGERARDSADVEELEQILLDMGCESRAM